MTEPKDVRTRDQQIMSRYYNVADGPEAVQRFLKGVASGVDDLDNVLYYLLNQFEADYIKSRLKLAAEVHPNEVARRMLGPVGAETSEDGTEVNEAEEQNAPKEEPVRSSSKMEQARRLLGG